MALAAKIHRARRSHERQSVDLPGTLRDGAWTAIDVVIEDLSQTGFRIQSGPDFAVDEPISLGLSGMGSRTAVIVRKVEGRYGCEFDIALTVSELRAVLASAANEPLPFPGTHLVLGAPPVQIGQYSRRVRMVGVLALISASWGIVGLAAALLF